MYRSWRSVEAIRIAAAICERASFEPTVTDALQVEANVEGWSIF